MSDKEENDVLKVKVMFLTLALLDFLDRRCDDCHFFNAIYVADVLENAEKINPSNALEVAKSIRRDLEKSLLES